VSKVCTDIAMRATKLNVQVQLTSLRAMCERGTATRTSDQRRQLDLEYQDWARLQGRGPHTESGHGRNRHVGWQGAVGDEMRGPARNLNWLLVLEEPELG
jgi:hypothetical protein